MTTAEVTTALANRKTVRITYSRSTDLHRVDITLGDTVVDHLVITANDDLAEGYARCAARILGLDITRVDVP